MSVQPEMTSLSKPIEVRGGPWPERWGCTGRIVEGHGYPWSGKLDTEVVVLLDDDPLEGDGWLRGWSMVIDRRDIRWREIEGQGQLL